MHEAGRVLAGKPGISFASDMYDALDGADALLIATEWKVFRAPDFDRVKALLKTPLIIDGRNLYAGRRARPRASVLRHRPRMKILQLNFEKGWRGGRQRDPVLHACAFRKAGHEVEVMCREGAPLAERARQEGFVAHTCRNVPGQLAFLAGAGRYDIIHAQTANTITWAVLTKWLHRRPVAFSRRASFVVKPGDEWKTGFKWRHADLFVAISEMAASEPRRLGIEPVIIRSAVRPTKSQRRKRRQPGARRIRSRRQEGRWPTSAALIRDKDR